MWTELNWKHHNPRRMTQNEEEETEYEEDYHHHDKNKNTEELAECWERQAAELELVTAAYDPSEAWCWHPPRGAKDKSGNTRGDPIIHRKILLPYYDEEDHKEVHTSAVVPVVVSLRLPREYPLHQALEVTVRLEEETPSSFSSSSSNSSADQRRVLCKIVYDALPELLRATQEAAAEPMGEEAVWAVLTRLEDWVTGTWPDECFRRSRALVTSPPVSTPLHQEQLPVVVLGTPATLAYGALVLVDHMNDAKAYRKWLRKTGKETGCHLMVKQTYGSDNDEYDEYDEETNNLNRATASSGRQGKPIILVGLCAFHSKEDSETNTAAAAGAAADVSAFLKRWRTSKVDVDSKGRACLERQMRILVEGPLEGTAPDNQIHWKESASKDRLTLPKNLLEEVLDRAGGPLWKKAFQDIIFR